MANLRLSYKEVWTKVSEFLGLGSSPTDTDLSKVKSITLRAYRKFLSPVDANTGQLYKWSFLQNTTTLSVETGIDTYKLPIGFANLVLPFTHTTPISYNPTQKPLEFIYLQKSQTTGSGYPRYFALKTGNYDTITGQQIEVMFYPTPSANLTYYYTYDVSPIAPVNDNDILFGSEFASECILELALAVADLQENDNAGVHANEATILLQATISSDKNLTLCTNLGSMRCSNRNDYVRTANIYLDGTQILPDND